MPTPSGKFPLGLKLILPLAVLAAGAYLLIVLLRPVAVVEPVVAGEAIDAKPGSVTVMEKYAMDLKTEQGGRVVEKNFRLERGREVKKGDVLAQLDPTDLLLEIAQQKINYAATQQSYAADHSSELKLESAHTDLKNFTRLNKLGNYPDNELVKRQREVEAMEQAFELEKISRQQVLDTFANSLKMEERKKEKMTIVSPLDGTISQVFAHPGDLIGPGSAVATLITTEKVVEGKISEEDFANVRVGEDANVTFLPYGAQEFDARVEQLLPTADPETQRHLIYLRVKMPPGFPALQPGTNGEVSIVVGRRMAPAVVPRRALFSLEGDNVFVVKDGRVALRKVRTGFVWARGAEILEGLAPGEQVIVDELQNFHAGDRVRVRETPSDVVQK